MMAQDRAMRKQLKMMGADPAMVDEIPSDYLSKVQGMLSQSQSVLEVKRFEQWGRDYLTVTNNWDGLISTVTSGELPPVMSVITSVNGVSTKEMTTAAFDRVCATSKELNLVYLQKKNGENVEKKVTIQSNAGQYFPGGFEKQFPMQKPNTINMVADSDFDFFEFNTFDFRVEGDDKLMDRSILEAIAEVYERRGMKRDKQNPDLIFTVQKSLNQTTNSVYVPETQQVVNTGYTTAVKRNVFTGKNYVSTQSHNTVVRSGGYTHTGVSATFHLVFTVFKNDTTQADDMPVVWKLDFNKFASSAIDILSVTNDEVSFWCSQYPFNDVKFSYIAKTAGIIFESEEAYRKGMVANVLPGTDAYAKGLRGGDQIVRAYTGGIAALLFNRWRLSYFKPNSSRKRFYSWFWVYCFPVWPWCNENRAHSEKDYLFKKPALFLEDKGQKAHFVVKKANGKKKTIDAPFGKGVYNYEYIY